MSFIKKIINALSNNQKDISSRKNKIEDFSIDDSFKIQQKSLDRTQQVQKDYQPVIERPQMKTNQELNSVEILMLDYMDGMSASNTSFPGYWHYQYNVKPTDLIKKLLNNGFIEKDTSLSTNMARALAKDLKQLLKENQLKVSGNKDELIERLLENVPADTLKPTFNQEVYKLTDKGTQVLKNNDHIKFFHSHSNLGISISMAHEIRKKRPELSKYDIAWQQLNISSTEHVKKGNWGLYRNDRLSMATVLTLENKLPMALGFLFEVCYYDLSGLSNNFNLEFLDIYKDHFFPYEKSLHTIAPGVINRILNIKELLILSDEEFKTIYFNRINDIKTPIHLFTKEEVLDIIIFEMNDDKSSVRKIYTKAQKRL